VRLPADRAGLQVAAFVAADRLHLAGIAGGEHLVAIVEVGPMAYTPGTKMPEQQIGSAEDRAALMKFLEKATK